jgi:metal-responsive CopG/Arc/MetJ family transcriptional regulator
MDSEYVSISIPRDLFARIRKIVLEGSFGYRNPTELIVEASRQKVDQLEDKLLEVKARA